jgi:PAS domain S-box-containing protein
MVDKIARGKNGKSQSAPRDAAEKRLGNSPDAPQELKEKSLEEVIHELQVHQSELEAQNEELKRVQFELEASRNKYQDLYDFAPVGYFTLTPKGIIIEVNLAMADLLGMPGSKLIGRGFGHFVAPESLDQWDQHIIRVLAREEKQTCDLRLKREDGSLIYARLDGIRMDSPVKGSYVIRIALIDISERRRLEEAIKQSEEMFRTVADFTYDWEYWIDPDGSLVYISPSCERITGYRSDEFINNPGLLKDIIHPADQLLVGNYFDSIDSAPPYSVEFRIVSPTRETRWIGHRCQAVYGDDGRFLGRRVSNRDITKLKEIEEIVKQRTEELERRNNDLEQFAYVASHDLQEPLRMVSSYMGLLERRYKGRLDADADEFIGYAVDGAKRMRMLINDLLEYSRVGTHGKPFGPVDCETLLNRSLDHLQLMIEDSGATVTHDHLPTVIGDGAQLMRLFQNLINNSLKFRKDASPLIHVSAEPCDGDWLFSVRDNGIGIDPQYADRIFVIFQRLHDREEYPGTGIGLAICKKIVERHGGRIRVQSGQDKGATFIFTIPRQDSKS